MNNTEYNIEQKVENKYTEVAYSYTENELGQNYKTNVYIKKA